MQKNAKEPFEGNNKWLTLMKKSIQYQKGILGE